MFMQSFIEIPPLSTEIYGVTQNKC